MNFIRYICFLIMLATITALSSSSCSDKGEEPENRAPIITSAASVNAIVDEMFSYTATAGDPDGTIPDIRFENIPSWLDTTGVIISGLVDTTTQDTSFTVIAADDFLADTLQVQVDVVMEEPPISYTVSVQPIFDTRCANSGCHLNGDASGGLRLDSYALLMQGGSSGDVVIAGNADGSILVQQIEGSRTPQMPLGGSELSSEQIQAIRNWIDQGAQDN